MAEAGEEEGDEEAERPPTARFRLDDIVDTTPPAERIRRLPRLLRLAVRIVWQAAPRPFALSAAIQVLVAVGLAGQVLLLRALLGDLLGAETAPSFGAVLPEVLGLAAIGGGVALANAVLDAQQRILGALVSLHTTDQLIDTAVAVDLVTYESPAFHDRLQRAQVSSTVRPTQLAHGILGVGNGVFAVTGVGIALVILEPLFAAVLVFGFVPAWLATSRAGRLTYRFSLDQTERDRRRMYLFSTLTRKEEAQEIRAFDLGGFLARRHRVLYQELIAELRRVIRRRLRIVVAGQMLSALVFAGALAVLVWMITDERISLTAAGSAAGAMVLLTSSLRNLAGSIGSLYEGSLYLEDFVSFVDLAPRIAAERPTQPAPERLDLVQAKDVSFTYPTRTQPSLVDASLELRRGEVVALVGENGSGKTTFAKLLAGLYRPATGTILWDGIDTTTVDPTTAHARVAVIFQDFVRWQLSAYDNIALGDHTRAADEERVVKAAEAAGVHAELAALERGYHTLLGPQFYGGSSLSGGQWQRIALARAFFRDTPLVILDEPAASLDPRAEAALYASMGDLFRGRGVLLISHRYGSVRTADRIYVLDGGRVVEHGDHDQLMAHDGQYAELFRLQAQWYVD